MNFKREEITLIAKAMERETDRWFWWYSNGQIFYTDKKFSDRWETKVLEWKNKRDFPDYRNKERFSLVQIYVRENI